MSDDLKPCPFCGGDKNIICETEFGFDHVPSFAVSCRYPDCHGAIFTLGYGYFATKEKAIAAWNTRAKPLAERLFDQQIADYVKHAGENNE
jgi:Lar family restriction alleviation protein